MSTLVLALNPSIDAEWRVDRVQWEEKNLVQSERRWAGGKGVNVARWLQHLGGKPRLLLPAGGATGTELVSQLQKEGLTYTSVSIDEGTRVNVIVTTASGGQLRFNPLGPKLKAGEWDQLFQEVSKRLPAIGTLVLSGSLPRQAPVAVYARLIRSARTSQCKALLDADGEAFAAAVKSKPFLTKPNEHELAQWAGKTLSSESAVITVARDLSKATGGWVLVSRGGRGAILVNIAKEIALRARVPAVDVVNTVGAGDAMLAGVARQIEAQKTPEDWLRWGAATGTAATQFPAGVMAPGARIAEVAKQVAIESVA